MSSPYRYQGFKSGFYRVSCFFAALLYWRLLRCGAGFPPHFKHFIFCLWPSSSLGERQDPSFLSTSLLKQMPITFSWWFSFAATSRVPSFLGVNVLKNFSLEWQLVFSFLLSQVCKGPTTWGNLPGPLHPCPYRTSLVSEGKKTRYTAPYSLQMADLKENGGTFGLTGLVSDPWTRAGSSCSPNITPFHSVNGSLSFKTSSSDPEAVCKKMQLWEWKGI